MARADIGAEGLRVAIGFPSAVMLVIGGIVGVGVFVNPAVVARDLHSPALALTAWTLGGVIALLGAFIYAELAARFPATGGEYVYLRRTYGPLAGFLYGWTTLLVVQTGGMAAVAIIFARNLGVLVGGGLSEHVVVVAALAALAAVNCLGVRSGNWLQTTLGALRVGAIAALIIAGLLLAPNLTSQRPPGPVGSPGIDLLKTFGAAMIPVVFSYGGWQTANFVAGEIKHPGRNLARALVVGVIAVVALYLLVNLACLRALGVEALGRTPTPASDVLERTVGPVGARLAAAAIALSAITFMSQSILTGPRVSFAMARDGLFFRKVADLGETSRVPVMAIILQAMWTGVLALSGSYEQILSYVIAMNFLFFGLSASCLFVLRRRERASGSEGPAGGFRVPWHPWTTGAFILACVAVVAASFWAFPVNSLIGYAILVLGVPPYLYWRGRSR
ncbi:MAG TPA: amino acid permease [Caulobacteraceae bacterium]|nr:amino acid permease [Caulobacteraceae bacterium]